MMALPKAPAIIASLLLGLGLSQIDSTRLGSDRTVRVAGSAHKTAPKPVAKPAAKTEAMARPQNSDDRQASAAQGIAPTIKVADHSALSSPSSQGRPARAVPRSGFRTARDGYTPGDMSESIYGSLTGPDVAGPIVYWAPGRWYPYPGFGDKRVFMPQPEGVWGR